jgi:uncharacterized membrane protein YgdD (TMEM256/DUF423 family)
MTNSARRWIVTGGLLGAVGVLLGAFAAHGLPDFLTRMEFADVDRRLDIYEKAARYQMYSALALVAIGILQRESASRVLEAAAWCHLCGVLIFSGLLYLLALSGPESKWLGAVVPIGGVLMVLGWLGLALGAGVKGDP